MKLQTVTPDVLAARCTYRTDTGRRCRLPVSDAYSSLCRQHRAEQLREQTADHHLELVRNFEGFQTAQGINHSLKHLYEVLAQNRISPRRASVLAYINSLLLRTLPQIDADNDARIIETSSPRVILPVPVEDDDTDDDFDLHPDSSSNSGTNLGPEPAPATISDPAPAQDPDSANTWDPSLPAPDPNKKPS